MISSVLIVDDDLILVESLKGAFENRGLRVWGATTEAEALRCFRDSAPDLVVLDYRMPGRDGISLLREMHVFNPLPVYILLTGFGSIPMAVESMKEGAGSVMQKPCDVDAILNEANKVSEKKQKLFPVADTQGQPNFDLDNLERAGIMKALKATSNNVSKAAILLGIDRRTLQRKMKRSG